MYIYLILCRLYVYKVPKNNCVTIVLRPATESQAEKSAHIYDSAISDIIKHYLYLKKVLYFQNVPPIHLLGTHKKHSLLFMSCLMDHDAAKCG